MGAGAIQNEESALTSSGASCCQGSRGPAPEDVKWLHTKRHQMVVDRRIGSLQRSGQLDASGEMKHGDQLRNPACSNLRRELAETAAIGCGENGYSHAAARQQVCR